MSLSLHQSEHDLLLILLLCNQRPCLELLSNLMPLKAEKNQTKIFVLQSRSTARSDVPLRLILLKGKINGFLFFGLAANGQAGLIQKKKNHKNFYSLCQRWDGGKELESCKINLLLVTLSEFENLYNPKCNGEQTSSGWKLCFIVSRTVFCYSNFNRFCLTRLLIRLSMWLCLKPLTDSRGCIKLKSHQISESQVNLSAGTSMFSTSFYEWQHCFRWT